MILLSFEILGYLRLIFRDCIVAQISNVTIAHFSENKQLHESILVQDVSF